MLFGILTLLVALSISAIAAYYSIVGLTAIFAAAMFPIILMGSVLEVGKIITTVWLHRNWHRAPAFSKVYLTVAVIVLMFITSMGIFGFLSKAHIEQTSQATEGVAQLEIIEQEISRYQELVNRSEQRIQDYNNSSDTEDAKIQEKINQEQQRIDTAYDRLNPRIEEQQKLLEENLTLYTSELDRVDDKLKELDAAIDIDTGDRSAVKKLQALVGARPDGAYGSGTARQVTEYRKNLQQQRSDVLASIQKIRSDTTEEIARIRKIAEQEIADSNKLISRLRDQLGRKNEQDFNTEIAQEQEKIKSANTELEGLLAQKYAIESEARKLEAEVGPVKYIAEFIYGTDADYDLLEAAVRWVIIIIVAVFDPLAIMLVLAATMHLEWTRNEKHGPEAKQQRIEELEMKIEEYNEFLLKLEQELDRLTEEDKAKDARITELEQAISDAQEEKAKAISELEALVDAKEAEFSRIVDELNSNIDDLTNANTDRENVINDLKTQIKALEEKEPEIVEKVVEVEKIVEDESKILEAKKTAEELEKQIQIRDAAMERLNEKYKLVEKARTPSILQAKADDEDEIPPATFGSLFPESPVSGQLFTKTDVFPHTLYKYNGKKWIEVDKEGTDSYLTEDYIRHLVEAVAKGSTELEDLTEQEKHEMTNWLSNGKA